MIWTIAKFEFSTLWRTNIGWASYFVISLILAYLFLGYIDNFITLWQNKYSVSDVILAQLYGDAAVLALLVVPTISCRSLVFDSPYSPLTLYICSPVSFGAIVTGKFIGNLLFMLPVVMLTIAMSLAILNGTEADYLRIVANTIGLTGVMAVLVASALFFSVLLNHTLAATMATFGIMMLLWVLDSTIHYETAGAGIISYIALMPHFESPTKGWLTLSDLSYFVIATTTLLVATVEILKYRHTQVGQSA